MDRGHNPCDILGFGVDSRGLVSSTFGPCTLDMDLTQVPQGVVCVLQFRTLLPETLQVQESLSVAPQHRGRTLCPLVEVVPPKGIGG